MPCPSPPVLSAERTTRTGSRRRPSGHAWRKPWPSMIGESVTVNAPTTVYRPKRASLILTEAEREALENLADDPRFEGRQSRAAGWAFRLAFIVASADKHGPADPEAALLAWAKGRKG